MLYNNLKSDRTEHFMNNATNSPKIDKRTKASINYFKKTETLKYVGGGILIAGLLCLWLGWGIVGFIFAFIGTPTGLVLFFIGASGRASDADMDTLIERKMSGLEIGIDNEKHYQLKLLKHLKEITISGYRFDEGVMMKKLKDGSIRTSVYCRSIVKILKDSLYIVSREVTLIEEEVTDNTYEIPYDSIKTLEIERENKRVVFNNNTLVTKPCYFHIVTDTLDLRFPIVDAITSDEMITSINRQITLYQEEQSSNNQ